MKVIIAYPPLNTEKGVPLLSQNRQFQYFKEPTYIYPVVPAYAATLLKQNGFEVKWKDCIAENVNEENFFKYIKEEKPDLIAFETKTPVVKQHWKIINRLKAEDDKLKAVLFGDHVTALPEESFKNSNVDFVLTGGDYDFLLLNLCKALNKSPVLRQAQDPELSRGVTSHQSPVVELEVGIYYRENGEVKDTGKFQLNHNLDSLPVIDRDLTNWQLYAYKNGNFKRTPGTYIMSGRDCWWGRCTFCSWPTLYPKFRPRPVENVLDEIGQLTSKYNVKEIMDDTGTFPVGEWLYKFCDGMIKYGFNKKISIDCNMRFGVLSEAEYKLMKKAGFRLILFGLESANQNTLDKLDKNLKSQEIIKSCTMAKKAGLYPHITIMFGYPWESYKDALNTLKLGRWLLKKGIAYTVQATIVIPYPGSRLYSECNANSQLLTQDWDDYDMKRPVMETQFGTEKIPTLVQGIYNVVYNPEFILRKIFAIRDMYDILYFFRGFNKVIGHIFDFK